MISIGPVGRVSVGHVLDVDKKRFEEALRAYDPMLYVRWNPKKVKGHGCWEIRRKPEYTSTLDVAEFNKDIILVVGPREVDIVNHVLDCAFLNYDQLRKLREMDTRQYGDAKTWQELVERKTRDKRELERSEGLQARKYAITHFKRQINAFREYVLNGGNPHAIANFWDSTKELE